MAHSALEQHAASERRIRERAYYLWEQDGRPHGRDQEFWERARQLIATEDGAGAGALPNSITDPGSPRETGMEEAPIQPNLGEFPHRFTDQGDAQPAPTGARSPRKRKQSAGAMKADAKPKAPTRPRRRKK